MANEDPNSPEGTIPVPTAMDMTANWRLFLNANEPNFQVRSYYISIVSLQNMLKYNPDAEGVRAYIGLGDLEDIHSTKLLFIPVVDGKEVPYRQIPSENGLGGCDTDDCSNIYNLNDPCPPVCAPGGPPDTCLDS
jgi:hypothetical protein